jgi:hypothetical protein
MPTVLFVLMVLAPTTKEPDWFPMVATPVSMEQCKSIATPDYLATWGGKGPIIKWKCVRYRRY